MKLKNNRCGNDPASHARHCVDPGNSNRVLRGPAITIEARRFCFRKDLEIANAGLRERRSLDGVPQSRRIAMVTLSLVFYSEYRPSTAIHDEHVNTLPVDGAKSFFVV